MFAEIQTLQENPEFTRVEEAIRPTFSSSTSPHRTHGTTKNMSSVRRADTRKSYRSRRSTVEVPHMWIDRAFANTVQPTMQCNQSQLGRRLRLCRIACRQPQQRPATSYWPTSTHGRLQRRVWSGQLFGVLRISSDGTYGGRTCGSTTIC